ncbi:NAD-dependent dehydratase, partial [Acinetobacter sp. FNA11]|nr:NAD-dependent dehydratase [Acinetobacter pollinis]
MSHVFIVGGSGQVARKVIQKLHQRNVAVTAMYR